MDKRRRHLLPQVAKFAVTILLLVFLFTRIEYTDLRATLSNIKYRDLALGALFLLLGHLINVARWQILSQPCSVPYRTLLVFYGVGLFSNSFLPTGFGGDGVRVLLLSRIVSPRQAMLSVGLDRGIGLIGLSALLAIGLWFGLPPDLVLVARELVSKLVSLRFWIIGVFSVTVVVTIILAVLKKWPNLRSAFEKASARPGENVNWLQMNGRERILGLSGGYLLSVLSALCITLANLVLLQGMGIPSKIDIVAWLVLAVNLSLLLPVSVNGLGIREATYVTVLGAYGIASTPALVVALLTRLAGTLFAALGGIAWLSGVRPNGASSPIVKV